MNYKCGIVVPTLGLRNVFLVQCLQSIRNSGDCHIAVVAPKDVDLTVIVANGLIDQRIDDPGGGLAQAINHGLRNLPDSIEYFNWLGDDDLLQSQSLVQTSRYLDMHKDVVMVFGSCDYIDTHSNLLWNNRSGQWAVPLMRIGPCLIPQPGSLFRRNVFEELGGLNVSLKWAFDFELFLRMSKKHEIRYLKETLSCFRWHSESLSVGGRKGSVAEASRVRKMHLPKSVRPLSNLWEIPVKFATEYAGYLVSRNLNRISDPTTMETDRDERPL